MSMETDVTELKVDSKILQENLMRLEQKVDHSLELSQKTLAIVEGLAGKMADLDQENKMGATTLHRHDGHIQELARATGTTLSPA